jgi:hypothetical protein
MTAGDWYFRDGDGSKVLRAFESRSVADREAARIEPGWVSNIVAYETHILEVLAMIRAEQNGMLIGRLALASVTGQSTEEALENIPPFGVSFEDETGLQYCRIPIPLEIQLNRL